MTPNLKCCLQKTQTEEYLFLAGLPSISSAQQRLNIIPEETYFLLLLLLNQTQDTTNNFCTMDIRDTLFSQQ